jgi:Nif-specific regulatory protein
MPNSADLTDFLRRVLAAQVGCEDPGQLLTGLLDELAELLGAGRAVVLRATPPQWTEVSHSGGAIRQLPTEVAAAALDESRLVSDGGWTAMGLGAGYVLAVEGRIAPSLLEKAGSALGAAVVTVQAMHSRLRRARRLEKILEITHAWGQSDCMESLLQAMAEAATELLQADRASIFLWDRANRQLVGRPALGVAGGELRIPDDKGIVGQVVQSNQPRRVGGGLGEEQIDRRVDTKTGYTTQSILCVPLVAADGQCLGAFEVLNKRHGHFTDGDEQGLIELAAHAAVALRNTRQFEELVSKHQQLVAQAAEGIQLVGNSPAIEAVRSTIGRIADTDLAILILGENGTGKEVVARSIHYLSRRREQPFIAVNCAALTETLLESELFGHEKGAFTDAHESRAGKFELASGGTLFLDEIGDMSLGGQAKLLRVLEDKTVVRVGGSTPIHTEVRILAATNQNLASMVRERRFREDLFFRLNVVSLELPPLRDRGKDVLILAEHFLEGFCRNMGRKTPKFSAAARKGLLAHRWPGNVRELRNLTERIAYLSTGEQVEPEDLAFIDAGGRNVQSEVSQDLKLAEATREFQQRYIQQAIGRATGNMSHAAQRLGLHRSNLYRKMRQLGLETDE